MTIATLLPQRYVNLRKLGASELAEVYLARQVATTGAARQVVVKRFSPRIAESGRGGAFIDEVLAAAALSHPHMAHILDVGEADGGYYVASESWRGTTLRGLTDGLTAAGRMVPMALSVTLATQILEALRYAHAFADDSGRHLNLVHCALSPDNVVVTTEGMVLLLDFGAAWPERFLRDAHASAPRRFAYAAPECLRGQSADGRADLFSVGVMLYELTVGQRLFATDVDESALEERQVPPPTFARAGYPVDLESIVMGALEHDANQRVSSADEMLAKLERFVENTGTLLSARRLGQLVTDTLGVPLGNPLDIEDSVDVEAGVLGPEDLDFDRDALFEPEGDPELSLPGSDASMESRTVVPRGVEVEVVVEAEVSSVELLMQRRGSTVIVTDELVEEEIDLEDSTPDILLDVPPAEGKASTRAATSPGAEAGEEPQPEEPQPDEPQPDELQPDEPQRTEHTSAALRAALNDLERALSAAEEEVEEGDDAPTLAEPARPGHAVAQGPTVVEPGSQTEVEAQGPVKPAATPPTVADVDLEAPTIDLDGPTRTVVAESSTTAGEKASDESV